MMHLKKKWHQISLWVNIFDKVGYELRSGTYLERISQSSTLDIF